MEQLKKDLTKTDPNYYKVGKEPDIRTIDSFYYLTVGGKSAPEDQKFLTAIETIYAIAYGIKFLCKAEDNDFTVPKMECFWSIEGGLEVQHQFAQTPRTEWVWKIVIRMPDFVEQGHFFRSVENARGKKTGLNFTEIKYELLEGGLFAQILHIGSYENEEPTLQKLHGLIEQKNLQIAGYHREIYLNDPRKTAEEKLKTILRYRVK